MLVDRDMGEVERTQHGSHPTPVPAKMPWSRFPLKQILMLNLSDGYDTAPI